MQRTTHTGDSGRKPPGRPQIASFAAHTQRSASHTQAVSAVYEGLIRRYPTSATLRLGRAPRLRPAVTIITKS
jgi:hypothetical protein